MTITFNILVLHVFKELLRITFNLYFKEMENRLCIIRMSLKCKLRIGDLRHISSANLLSALCPLRKIFKRYRKNCSLNAFKTIIVTDHLVVISDFAALILHNVHVVIILGIISAYSATLTKSIQVLAWIKAKAADVSKSSDHPAFNLGSMSLCTVLNNKKIMLISYLFNSGEIKRLSIQMDSHDSLGLVCYLLFNPVRVNFPSISGAINEYRCCSCICNSPC